MASLIADRYEEIRMLGEGGLSRVVLVRDTQSGQLRALKQLRTRDAATAQLVRNEYAALARVRHENVVRVHEFGVLPTGEPYFTMDYIDGAPIDEMIPAGDVARTLAVSLQVLRGLAALHAGGLVHCDLKPDNVLVSAGADGDGAPIAHIVDLGFAGRLADAAGDKVRGTPGYAAPELLAGAPYSRESDLYALGATLYRVLSGRPAFAGRDAGAVLAAQRRGPPGVLALRAAGISTSLDAALLGLLSSDARHRASAAREWVEIAERRSQSQALRGKPADKVGGAAALEPGRVALGPMIGCDTLLCQARETLLSGTHTRAAVLVGPPGSGRTRIARELAIEAELAGHPVAWFDSTTTLTGDRASRLADRTFVVLEDTDLWAPEAVDIAGLEGISANGLAFLATQSRPPVEGDATLRMLLSLPQPPAPRVFELEPFSSEATAALVRSLLGSPPPEGLCDRLTDAAGSWPGPLIGELERELRDGTLREESGHWRLIDNPSRGGQGAKDEGEAARIWRGLDARTQATALARASWPLPATAADLADITGLDATTVESGLEELAWNGWLLGPPRSERVVPSSFESHVRSRVTGSAFEEIRLRLRGALRKAAQSGELRSAGDDRLSRVLLALGAQERALGQPEQARESLLSCFRIAWETVSLRSVADAAASELVDLLSANSPENAEPLALLARFEAMRNRGSHAEALWARASDLLPRKETSRRIEWVLERAENLQTGLDHAAALALISGELREVEHDGLPALLLGRALGARGWCKQRLGDWPGAESDFQQALALVPPGEWDDRAILLSRVGFAKSRRGDALQGEALLREALECAIRGGNPRTEARIRGNLGTVAQDQGDLATAKSETLQALALIKSSGSTQGQFSGANNLTSVADSSCDWPAWEESFRLLEEVGRASGNPAAYAQTCHFLANRCVRTGRLREAVAANRRARAWIAGQGNPERMLRIRVAGSVLSALRGDGRRARRRLRALLAEAQQTGHELVATFAAGQLCELELAAGNAMLALKVAKNTRENKFSDPCDRIPAILVMARAAVRTGDQSALMSVRAASEEELRGYERMGVRDAGPAREEISAYGALLLGDLDAFGSRWTAAREALRNLELLPRIVLGDWTVGLALLGRGKASEAISHLREAHLTAKVCGIRNWAASIAESILTAYEVVDPLLSVPDSDPQVQAGALLPEIIELLTSLPNRSEMLQHALAMVGKKVHADRGFILLTDEHAEQLEEVAQFGAPDDEARTNARVISRTIVRWVTRRGEVYQSNSIGSDPRLGSTQSVLDMSIRSLVCVPLRREERTIGTIYLESRAAEAHFSESDVTLVESFAHLVSVAIENSRLHDELRRSRDRVIGENMSLRRDASRRFSAPNIIGQSREMESVLGESLRVAGTSASVLITGESGTGKELVAKLIHYASSRADRPMLSLNCAALATDLLEAELFGTEKGAATGVIARPGIFERADGGTLFLDEIGDMPLALQVKLLRVLQERDFMRVGGSRVQQTDFRLLSATNKELPDLFDNGEFRDDLYHRITQFEIHIPPLRDRKVDIPPLAEHFLRQFCELNARPIPRISEAFFAAIGSEPWVGNVRQLENYVVHCAVMCDGGVLEPVIPPPSKDRSRKRRAAASAALKFDDGGDESVGDLKSAIEDTERRWIERALSETQGNQRQAAAALGLKEATLRYKIRTLGAGFARAGASRRAPRAKKRRR